MMTEEIGGYFQLERFTGREYHEGLLRLNLGRTASHRSAPYRNGRDKDDPS